MSKKTDKATEAATESAPVTCPNCGYPFNPATGERSDTPEPEPEAANEDEAFNL